MLAFLKKNYISWPALSLLFFVVAFNLVHLDNFVQTNGDDPGYQILARNYANNKGIMVFNIYESAEKYEFDNPNEKSVIYFKNDKQTIYFFYRTPGYPIFFLGNLYKLLGTTSPYLGKLSALLVLCLVAGGMPWLGSQFWGERGWWIGLVSSPVQIAYTAHWCGRIVTEPLIIGAIFLISSVFVIYQKKQNLWTGAILGLALAYGLLVKGSLIFIPILAFAFLGFWSIKNKKKIYPLIVAVSLFFVCMISWSNYATEKMHKRIWISEQTDDVLLDGNNEFTSGWWAPEWHQNPKSFYNNDHLANKSSFLRVLNFYKHFPKKLIELPIKKLMTAFIPQLFLLLLMLLWGLRSLGFIIKKKNINYLAASFGLFIILAFSIVHTYFMFNQNLLIMAHSIIMSSFLYIGPIGFIAVGLLYLFFCFRKVLFTDVPTFFYIALLNFVALNIVLFGDARFVMVMHFLFILVFFEQSFSYFEQLKLSKQHEN